MTPKYALTGAPGCGKSSIVLALENSVFTIREAAEDYIKLRQAEGIEKPWEENNFQDKILNLQILREIHAEEASRGRIILADRGTLDGLAYYQIAGKKPSRDMKEEMVRLEIQKPYKKIFLVESLGQCKKTGVRREDLETALELEKLQEKNYRDLGFEVIRVVPGTVRERARKVEEEIYRR